MPHCDCERIVRYKDGSEAFGFNIPFQGGTHGMMAASAVIIPAKPVAVLSLYCLFRLRYIIMLIFGVLWAVPAMLHIGRRRAHAIHLAQYDHHLHSVCCWMMILGTGRRSSSTTLWSVPSIQTRYARQWRRVPLMRSTIIIASK